ncbi:ricin-type beta-trefoil lectin domain protein [Streptomyces sp. NPDC020667]|uniref:ricin-type beta-trefoil lectin domain protein n=1 Tax=Streptomyces sp. NPDC020667 TaxID=3154895 RepID=UPI00340EB339
MNTATGAFYDRSTDVALVGVGTPFSLDRTYRSDSGEAGLLGRGWSTPFDSKLAIATGNSATLQDADGAWVVFKDQGGGNSYAAPAGSSLVLTKAGATYTATGPDGTRRTFSTSGQLTSITGAGGQGLTLAYSSGRLASVKDAAGRTVSFTLDGSGLLTKVALPDGTSVSYGYTDGLLTSVKDQVGKTSAYTYDGNKRLSTATGRGGGQVSNTYDASGRVVSQTDGSGKTSTFTWDNKRESHVTDPNGGVWTDVYSGNVLLESINPYGDKVSYSYDRNLHPVSITDASGNTTEMAYDTAGRLITRRSPSSVGLTETWNYDSQGNISSHTDGRGKASTYAYDKANRVVAGKDPAGGTVTYAYTEQGALASVTTPRGRTTTYTHDAAGNRTAVTTPLGEKTTFRYDAAGRVTAMTDPRGNVAGAEPAAFTTTYTYEGRGLLSAATDPLGHTTAYGYDGAGRLTSVKDPAGRITAYAYDSSGRLTETTNPAGKKQIRTYDANGNLASVSDALGNRTTYAYDKANRLISVVSPRGNASGANAAAYTTSYGYDANGNRTKATDPTGAVTTSAYDALGRLVSVTDALGQTSSTTYDADDNVLTSTDPLGNVTRHSYTDTGLPATSTDPLGKVTSFDYDADGHRTRTTSPEGRTTTWSYDDDGRTATQVDPRGNANGADAAQFTTSYTYDPAGNQTKVTDPLGKSTSTAYDATNRAVSAMDELGRTTKSDYDDLGRVAAVTGPDGAATRYTYNTAGDLATRKGPNGHTTTYGYDDAGRQTSVTDPLGRQKTYGYDESGNRTAVTNARGITARTDFDARGLPRVTTYTDSTPTVTVAYDAIGQRRSVTDGTGTRTLDYDAAGHLTAVTPGTGKGVFSYAYDDTGRVTERTSDIGSAGPTGAVVGVNGLCVDVDNGQTKDGTTIQSWTCAGVPAQQWTYDGAHLKALGKCAAATGPGRGAQVKLATCSNDALQRWTIRDNGELINAAGGKCMEISNGTNTLGTPITTWDCYAVAWHHWTLPRPTGAVVGVNGLCVDVDNGQTKDGTAIQSWTCAGVPAQQWTYDGAHLKALGKCAAATNSNKGAQVKLNTCSNDALQRWTFRDDGALVNAAGGKCMEISNGTNTLGTPITTWDCLDVAWHHWTLPKAAMATNTIRYGYDGDGLRTSETTTAGAIGYGYDSDGHLTTSTLPAANGYIEKRAYDNAGRLTAISNVKGSSALSSWSQTLDDAGQPVRIDVARAGKPAGYQYYDYDPAGRLVTECSSATKAGNCPDLTTATTYGYDQVGNRQTQNQAGVSTTYKYDDADQLTQSVTGSASRDFTYDADGNQTGAGGDTFAYDANNRLIKAMSGGTAYSYGYDADGNRTTASKDGSGLQRTTAWDINNALPLAAADYDGNGAVQAEYRYSPRGQIQAEVTGGSTYYHHRDLLGSVSDLTDAGGNLQTSYTYTAFGDVSQTNATAKPPANPFAYAGAYREPTTNAAGYYLRARNYDPATGRLTSTDPAPAPVGQPYASAYPYAANAPTRYTDPTGWTPDDPNDDHIKSFSEGAKVFGSGFVEGLKLPFEFVGDIFNAFSGKNGGAGGFVDKYLPVRPAYRLYRAAEMFRDQGCEALYDSYSRAADDLAMQIAATGLGGLRGWQKDAVFPPTGGRYYGGRSETRFGLPYYTPDHPTSKKLINPEDGQMNCGLCATAGDDLMAGKNPNSVPGADHPMFPADVEALTGRSFVRKGGLDPLVSDVMSWGPGARGIVGAWPRVGQGHYFNVVNMDGKVVFLDFQQGRANPANPRWRTYYLMRTN